MKALLAGLLVSGSFALSHSAFAYDRANGFCVSNNTMETLSVNYSLDSKCWKVEKAEVPLKNYGVIQVDPGAKTVYLCVRPPHQIDYNIYAIAPTRGATAVNDCQYIFRYDGEEGLEGEIIGHKVTTVSNPYFEVDSEL